MTKDELKALGLTDEQADAIVDDYGKNYVSKGQFNAKNEELKAAKGELQHVNGEIDALKKANKDNEGLLAQIDKMKADAKAREETHAAEVRKLHIDGIVERTVLASKAKNVKAVLALLDLEHAEVDGDTIKGLDKQLEGLKKTDAYLFDAVRTGGKPGEADGGVPKGVTREEFRKMSYGARAELHATNEALYRQLQEEVNNGTN